MPVIAAFLSYFKIIKSNFFIQHFRIAIFVLAFISALITPPDLLSMIFMMGPMLLLYLITIIVNRIFGKGA
jgi:sec-independent protein translocase protein TatC